MNKKIAIEIVKFAGALTIGAVIGAITRPAVKAFFKLDKSADPDPVPSEDIEEEEVFIEE